MTLDALPVLEPPSALSDDVCVCVNVSCNNLTEEEITAVISQMWKGRAPGSDGILSEMFKQPVHWLKTIID